MRRPTEAAITQAADRAAATLRPQTSLKIESGRFGIREKLKKLKGADCGFAVHELGHHLDCIVKARSGRDKGVFAAALGISAITLNPRAESRVHGLKAGTVEYLTGLAAQQDAGAVVTGRMLRSPAQCFRADLAQAHIFDGRYSCVREVQFDFHGNRAASAAHPLLVTGLMAGRVIHDVVIVPPGIGLPIAAHISGTVQLCAAFFRRRQCFVIVPAGVVRSRGAIAIVPVTTNSYGVSCFAHFVSPAPSSAVRQTDQLIYDSIVDNSLVFVKRYFAISQNIFRGSYVCNSP